MKITDIGGIPVEPDRPFLIAEADRIATAAGGHIVLEVDDGAHHVGHAQVIGKGTHNDIHGCAHQGNLLTNAAQIADARTGLGVDLLLDTLLEAAAAELVHLPWLVILPPDWVTTYGRETLLETPVWKTKALDDGSVLLVSHVDILRNVDASESKRNEHLGMESPISHML